MLPRLAILACLLGPLAANTPGGGPESGAPDVTLTDHGATVTLENGTLTATIEKDTAYITSLLYRGTQLVDTATQGIYYSMQGMDTFRPPVACTFSVTTNTPEMIDVCLKESGAGRTPAFDFEIHYVLRRGDTGIYTYSVLDHPAAYPEASLNIWRLVWKRPLDTFERLFVDDLRNREMPNSYDYANASPTPVAEIVHLNTGVLAGQDEGKYCYNARYYDTPVYGHATDDEDIGIWALYPAHEWFNDGPTKHDLTAAHYGMSCLMNMTHYNGSQVDVAAGEEWRKLYGPFLLYFNHDPAGAEACWEDAQAQVAVEQAEWPYAWLTGNPDFPDAAGRATITGTITIDDPLKPALDGEDAWIGLAAPDPGGHWQFEGERYQHWVKAGPGGVFSLPHVRPGTYTLYAFTEGAVGEFEHAAPVIVTAGETLDLGTLTWNVPRSGSWLAWEVGLPDRDSREFRHGDDYFTPFAWTLFNDDLPNPLVYDVSSSLASQDWNYCQTGYEPDSGPPRSAWPWEIHFNLPAVPASGDARLTLAFTGSNNARMQIFINGAPQFGPNLYPDHEGGNGLVRQSFQGKYALHTIEIPASELQVGPNTISLLQGRFNEDATLQFDHVMYDYVGLEMPALPGGKPDDADGDGLADAWELQHFLTLSPVAGEDSDGDGFHNADEQAGGSDPADPASVPTDELDDDLIDDSWEVGFYPSPFTVGPLDDSDGDGFNTWTEWKAGTGPTDDASIPGISTGAIALQPVADTAVWFRDGVPAYAATNYGSDVDIDNYTYPTVPIIALGYFRFDLSVLPSTATIDAATLTLTKAATNPVQSPQGTHSDANGNLVPERFAIYGLIDFPGNTPQNWNEATLTGDSTGDEFDFTNAGIDPPVDTTTRTLDLDGVGEVVDGETGRLSGSPLVNFLQTRVDATTHRGLATFITDIESPDNGKGYAFVSREGVEGSRPRLELDFTAGVPVPDPDEDDDGLDDAWEAHHFGDLDESGDSDADADGSPSWLEQLLGLDPNDPAEAFRASLEDDTEADAALSWPNAAGVTFTVESSGSLHGGWSFEASVAGSSSPERATHAIDFSDTRRFYRVSVAAP